MNSINYLKLDFRLIRGAIRYYVVVSLVALYMLYTTPIMGIGWLFFLLIIIASSPFSVESNEKCDKMYYMLPSKTTSMVLGRYLYLISLITVGWLIGGSIIVYFYKLNIISSIQVGITCIVGFMAAITCFCQYPIYYKFGMEKGKIISMLIYMVPAIVGFSLPSILNKSDILTPEILNSIVAFIMSNKAILPILGVLIISVVGMISYLFSCYICQRKEL